MAALAASQPSEEFPSQKDQYVYERQIGRGAFAEVYKARCVVNDRTVAIKMIDLKKSGDLDDITREVATMKSQSHPNVLAYYGSFVHQESQNPGEKPTPFIHIITQMMGKGSCLYVMGQAEYMGMGVGMHESWLGYILKETLQALDYFHRQNFVHRDIKAGNILLGARGEVVLADFGVSRGIQEMILRTQDGKAKTFVGTPCWMAPEVMEQIDGYDMKADIWSLGITALELAKGHAPYANHPPMKVLLYTIQNEPPSLKSYREGDKRNGETFSRGFKEVVRLCLQKQPQNRPTCQRLLGLPFFTKERKPDALVSDLLAHIPDVDSEDRRDLETRTPSLGSFNQSSAVTEGEGVATVEAGSPLRHVVSAETDPSKFQFEEGSAAAAEAPSTDDGQPEPPLDPNDANNNSSIHFDYSETGDEDKTKENLAIARGEVDGQFPYDGLELKSAEEVEAETRAAAEADAASSRKVIDDFTAFMGGDEFGSENSQGGDEFGSENSQDRLR